jgi:hypothetical protein
MAPNFDRWIHLNFYERKYLKEVIDSYDQIMATTDDVVMIASYYQLSIEEVTRAKNYAFRQGVLEHQFSPDSLMVEAWQRLATQKANQIDLVFLLHEIYESELVWNQNVPQIEAHQKAQKLYPWSDLLLGNR